MRFYQVAQLGGWISPVCELNQSILHILPSRNPEVGLQIFYVSNCALQMQSQMHVDLVKPQYECLQIEEWSIRRTKVPFAAVSECHQSRAERPTIERMQHPFPSPSHQSMLPDRTNRALPFPLFTSSMHIKLLIICLFS